MLSLELATSLEMEKFGAFLGSMLQPGCFLALQGPLGAGKTCLTRGVVSAVAPESAHLVSSPTYAIMNSYYGKIPVYHFDFYRLSSADDILELGFEDYFYGDGVCVVEWAERLGAISPPDHLLLQLDYGKDGSRKLAVTPYGDISSGLYDKLSLWPVKNPFDLL